MATHSSILAWRIPMDRRAWWATVHMMAKSRHAFIVFMPQSPTALAAQPLGEGAGLGLGQRLISALQWESYFSNSYFPWGRGLGSSLPGGLTVCTLQTPLEACLPLDHSVGSKRYASQLERRAERAPPSASQLLAFSPGQEQAAGVWET